MELITGIEICLRSAIAMCVLKQHVYTAWLQSDQCSIYTKIGCSRGGQTSGAVQPCWPLAVEQSHCPCSRHLHRMKFAGMCADSSRQAGFQELGDAFFLRLLDV